MSYGGEFSIELGNLRSEETSLVWSPVTERERERERGNTLAVSHHSAWQSNVPDGEMCL